jgi:hypothetical protein
MLNNKNENHLYFLMLIFVVIFIFLNFSIGPTSIFGMAKFIQDKTGGFFGVDINTLDYLLISLVPIFGLLQNSQSKRNSFTDILKKNVIISITSIATFSVGLLILILKIGSPSENQLIPKHLRVDPFKFYATFLIALEII